MLTSEQKTRLQDWLKQQANQAALEESWASSGPDYSEQAEKARVRQATISFLKSLFGKELEP